MLSKSTNRVKENRALGALRREPSTVPAAQALRSNPQFAADFHEALVASG